MTVQSYGWKDLRAALVASATGGGAPALALFGPSGTMKQLSFGINDSVYVAAHVDHDYMPGSLAHVHVHWTTNGVDTNTVKWEVKHTLAKGHDQEAFGTDVIVNLEEAAVGTAWQHMITEDSGGYSLLEPDTVLIMEVKRITNGGTDNTDTVFGLFVDLHYQVQQVATPNRVPNFYS